MNSFLSFVHLPIVSFNSFWFGRRCIRWCIAACAASSASFSVVICFTGGFIVSFVGDGPRGLVGACLQIGGRGGKVTHVAGDCAGTSDAFLEYTWNRHRDGSYLFRFTVSCQGGWSP